MQKLATILISLVLASCALTPKLRKDEKDFSFSYYYVHAVGDKLINAHAEIRNPTNEKLHIFVECEFTSDYPMPDAATTTEVYVNPREVKIVKLETTFAPPEGRLIMRCEYFAYAAKEQK